MFLQSYFFQIVFLIIIEYLDFIHNKIGDNFQLMLTANCQVGIIN